MKRYGTLIDEAVQLASKCRNRPFRYLEIGVWTGEGAARLLTRVHQETGVECQYIGYDLFDQPTEVKDDQASRKRGGVSTQQQAWHVLNAASEAANESFDIMLIAGDTRETLQVDSVTEQDLIFIDGGHSFETIASDWAQVKQLMTDRTVVFFDDYYHDTDAIGAARTVAGISRKRYAVEIQPPDRIGNGRVVSLVRVAFKPKGREH